MMTAESKNTDAGGAKLSFTSPVLGVYVEGLEISNLGYREAARQIRRLLDRHLVVIVRDQSLRPDEQRDLVR